MPESNLSEAATLFANGQPLPEVQYPVCGSWRDGPDNPCMFASDSDSSKKYLNRNNYHRTNGEIPLHRCTGCGRPIHSDLCSAIKGSEANAICLKCFEETNSPHPRWNPDRSSAGETSGGKRRGNKKNATGSTRKRKRASEDNITNPSSFEEDLPPISRALPPKKKVKKQTTFMRNHSSMKRFWEYTHNVVLQKNHKWTNDDAFSVKPDQIVRYMKYKAYGNPNADTETQHPTSCRYETLCAIKKGISAFMPDKALHWSVLRGEGNPTRSNEVKELMKKVEEAEAKDLGAPSQARGPFVCEEYENIIQTFESNKDTEEALFTSSIFRTQYNMGARIDDVSKQKSKFLKEPSSVEHQNFCIRTKLPWSKNVRTKKQAPWQVLIGAMNEYYCALLGLALWLEYMLLYKRDIGSNFVNAFKGSNCEDTIRRNASEAMKKVLKDPEFITILEDLKGTHSMRKFAVDEARKRGMSKDDVDMRMRWVNHRRMQEIYASSTIPSVDGVVAAALCKDGPIHYHLKEYSGITDEWVCEEVSPQITAKYGTNVGKVLGRALLWSVYDTSRSKVVPEFMKKKIKAAYDKVTNKNLKDGENPVAKVPMYVGGCPNGNLILDPMIEDPDESVPVNETDDERLARLQKRYDETNLRERAFNQRNSNEHIKRLGFQIAALDSKINNLQTESVRGREIIMNQLEDMKGMMRKILKQPFRAIGVPRHRDRMAFYAANDYESAAADENSRALATVSRNPKCLHLLWQEYELGLNGKKAAKLFTAKERGKEASLYSKRKVFWQKVSEMIRAGWTSTDAINAIQNHYSGLSLTTTLLRMRADRKNKTYPKEFEQSRH